MFGTLRHHMVPEPNRTVCLNKYISYNGAARGSDCAECSLNIDMTKTDAVVLLSGSLPEFQWTCCRTSIPQSRRSPRSRFNPVLL